MKRSNTAAGVCGRKDMYPRVTGLTTAYVDCNIYAAVDLMVAALIRRNYHAHIGV